LALPFACGSRDRGDAAWMGAGVSGVRDDLLIAG